MKIFITVGTQKQDFSRLFKMCEVLEVGNEIVRQIGHSKYPVSDNDFLFSNDFERYVKEADLIITHGGVGSIMDGLVNDKKVIAVPRREKYKEHVNDHQEEVVNQFVEDNYILSAENKEELLSAFNSLSNFKPSKYESNNKYFNEQLNNTIKDLLK